MTINDWIDSVKDNHSKLGEILSIAIKREAHDVNFKLIPIEMFGNNPTAYSVDNIITLNSNAIVQNQSLHSIYLLIYIIFHEIGHQKRKYDIGDIDFNQVSLESFIEIANNEEKAADLYAHNALNNLAREFDFEELFENTNRFSSPSGYALYSRVYHTIMQYKDYYKNDINKLLTDLAHNKLPMNEDIKKVRKKIKEMLQKLLEHSPEIAEPKVKPAPTPTITPSRPSIKPNPLKIPTIKPDNLPLPIPKAKKKSIRFPKSLNKLSYPKSERNYKSLTEEEELKYFQQLDEKIKLTNLVNEVPMNFDSDNPHRPNTVFQKGIENKDYSPFNNIDFLQSKTLDQSTLERLSSEEFNEVVRTLQSIPKLDIPAIMTMIGLIKKIEASHHEALEQLALDAVIKNFGLPDELAQRLDAKIVKNISGGNPDSESPIKKAAAKLSDEQKQLAKKYIDKRIVQNALSMGSGYRAHKLFKQIKPALDNISPSLFNLYEKIIGNIEFFMWTTVFAIGGGRTELGKCQVDSKSMKGSAQATLFVILLHEVAKAAVELLFLQSVFDIAEEHGEDVYNYVLSTADRADEEQWMKLVGPRLWKYLHDAINYIVEARGNDYTIVAYLLNKISLLPPDVFLNLMNDVVNNGAHAIHQLEAMLDELEIDIEEYQAQNNQTPAPSQIMAEPDFSSFDSIMSQLNNLTAGDNEAPTPQDPILNHKPFDQMSTEELNSYIHLAVDASEFDKAAEARDELDKRGE